MIAKITKGASSRSISGYLHGPGKREEHEDPRIVGGNLEKTGSSDGREWARKMERITGRRPEARKPIWQCSLRNPEADRILTDKEWGRISRDFLREIGAEDRPHVVVRHGADHVHIVVSRVGFDKDLWNPRNDYYRVQSACRQMEQRYDLTPVKSSWEKRNPAPEQVVTSQPERAMRERGVRTWKQDIRNRVDMERVLGGNTNFEEFAQSIKRQGITVRTNKAGEIVYSKDTAQGVRSVNARNLGSDYQAPTLRGHMQAAERRMEGTRPMEPSPTPQKPPEAVTAPSRRLDSPQAAPTPAVSPEHVQALAEHYERALQAARRAKEQANAGWGQSWERCSQLDQQAKNAGFFTRKKAKQAAEKAWEEHWQTWGKNGPGWRECHRAKDIAWEAKTRLEQAQAAQKPPAKAKPKTADDLRKRIEKKAKKRVEPPKPTKANPLVKGQSKGLSEQVGKAMRPRKLRGPKL